MPVSESGRINLVTRGTRAQHYKHDNEDAVDVTRWERKTFPNRWFQRRIRRFVILSVFDTVF